MKISLVFILCLAAISAWAFPSIRVITVDQSPAKRIVAKQLTRNQWIEREYTVLRRLGRYGIPVPLKSDLVTASWQAGYGVHDRFIPAGLTADSLLKVWRRINPKDPNGTLISPYARIPTVAGVFQCDISRIMRPTAANLAPFFLTYKEQVEWAQSQGGSTIASIEEVFYLILRMQIESGQILFRGGGIRCRNSTDYADITLAIEYDRGTGIGFSFVRHNVHWPYWCVPERLVKISV